MRAAFSPRGPSARPILAAITAIVIVGVVVACGTGGYVKGGDAARGKQLFVAKCGACHTLAAAGTTQMIGPNLDDAFAADRQQGFQDSSIQQIVADQIRDPLQPISCPGATSQAGNDLEKKCPPGAPVTPTASTVMPAKLVDGEDLVDVSWFVAKCAGNHEDASCQPTGGGKVTATDGKTIFQQAGCVGCHTLKDAGSSGTVGPNLDQAQPPKALVIQRVTNGKGAMPSFKGKLTPQQINAVADYVSSVAGK